MFPACARRWKVPRRLSEADVVEIGGRTVSFAPTQIRLQSARKRFPSSGAAHITNSY